MAKVFTVAKSYDGQSVFIAPFAGEGDGANITTTDDQTTSYTLPDDPTINCVLIKSEQAIYVSAFNDVGNPSSTWSISSQSLDAGPRQVSPGQTIYFYTPKAASITLNWYSLTGV